MKSEDLDGQINTNSDLIDDQKGTVVSHTRKISKQSSYNAKSGLGPTRKTRQGHQHSNSSHVGASFRPIKLSGK